MSSSLEPPNTHHLNAANGWIGLGNFSEATEELEKIAPPYRGHPNVLAVRWEIYAHFQKWAACVDLGRVLIELEPHVSSSWNMLSIALSKSGQMQAAWDCAYPKLEDFKLDWMLHYNCSCYAARLGLWNEAKRLIHQAMGLGNKSAIQQMVLDDPDLEALRKLTGLGTY